MGDVDEKDARDPSPAGRLRMQHARRAADREHRHRQEEAPAEHGEIDFLSEEPLRALQSRVEVSGGRGRGRGAGRGRFLLRRARYFAKRGGRPR